MRRMRLGWALFSSKRTPMENTGQAEGLRQEETLHAFTH